MDWTGRYRQCPVLILSEAGELRWFCWFRMQGLWQHCIDYYRGVMNVKRHNIIKNGLMMVMFIVLLASFKNLICNCLFCCYCLKYFCFVWLLLSVTCSSYKFSIFRCITDSVTFEIPELHNNCWLQAMMATTWGFSPSCNEDGTYGPKQCHLKRYVA